MRHFLLTNRSGYNDTKCESDKMAPVKRKSGCGGGDALFSSGNGVLDSLILKGILGKRGRWCVVNEILLVYLY